MRGAGPRAFCAGGDIRAMADSSRDKTNAAANFLRDEYRLNAMIGGYSKPYIALTHGIVMGGGAGVSVHGRYRLGDEDLAFAMPETGIGFVPDIGASFFLSRCPGETGMYLALTGARIGLGDALALGLITHSVAASDHDALIARLAEGEAAGAAIACFRTSGAACASLAKQRARIDMIFAAAIRGSDAGAAGPRRQRFRRRSRTHHAHALPHLAQTCFPRCCAKAKALSLERVSQNGIPRRLPAR